MAALRALDANEERDEAPLAMDPEKLDALAAVLERSASWYLATSEPEPAQAFDASGSEGEASAPPPESRVRASVRPLAKKERRELERKQHVLAAQRANEQRRERQRKREQRREQRLLARKQAAQPKITAVKLAPRAATTEAVILPKPVRRGWRVPWAAIAIVAIAVVLAWLVRKL